LAKRIKRPRGVVYKGLDELISLGLAEKLEVGKITRFRADHPAKLETIFNEKEKNIAKEKQALLNSLPDLVSAFNLTQNKPGVRYYEGIEGVRQTLSHIANNFKADTEIISFVKVLTQEFGKELNEAFKDFIKKRNEMNVKTRVIAIDTSEGKLLKEGDKNTLRETRLISTKNLPLDFPGGEIFIYEDEICAVMLEKNTYFAFTVQNKSITQLLKAFFEAEWELLSPREAGHSPLNDH
jgi:sugar-specific transcriptional regulator TrmB